jgi:hypothetical protein
MSSDGHGDRRQEAQWFAKQRSIVECYLEGEGVKHRGVASEPDWSVAPYVAIWSVESMKAPGAVGWWAISGDLPTDYLSGHDATDARTALARFAERWREVSAYMLRGEEHPTVRFRGVSDQRELGDLLRRRAQIIERWSRDDEIWE